MIPPWLSSGVIAPTLSPTGEIRAPYRATVLEFVQRFATSHERRQILTGLLGLRRGLRGAGLTRGFQWVDGSFLEQVEVTDGRTPNDIDVVTFTALGDGATQLRLLQDHPDIFDHDRVKNDWHVDHYMVDLSSPPSAHFARRVSYWYSMWSHRRDGLWKGFVELDLAEDDTAGAKELAKLSAGGQEES